MGLFEGRCFFATRCVLLPRELPHEGLTSRPTLPTAEPAPVLLSPGSKFAGCSSYALRPGEARADGNVVSDDGCSSDCQPEADFGCVVAGQPCEATTSPE
jgi:cysteine-rich repeat protein